MPSPAFLGDRPREITEGEEGAVRWRPRTQGCSFKPPAARSHRKQEGLS